MKQVQWLVPDWPVPSHVKALTTVRQGGFSLIPFESFNLAAHVGDDPKIVAANRKLLREQADLPSEPFWLTQVHGTQVVDIDHSPRLFEEDETRIEADASVAFSPNQVCVVLTADCVPILLCDKHGSRVSAIHAGWRGLAAGVIEAAVQKLRGEPSELLAWFGPAIGPKAFEVREDVLSAFKGQSESPAFQKTGQDTWLADLYQLATHKLKALGVTSIFGGEHCTYYDERFYSVRRSKQTGRQATLIWLTPS